jgi:hypothetical protein
MVESKFQLSVALCRLSDGPSTVPKTILKAQQVLGAVTMLQRV